MGNGTGVQEIVLPSPSNGDTHFFVVHISSNGGALSDPVHSPNLIGEYAQQGWPTTTNREGSFMLMVQGSTTLPSLTWAWDSAGPTFDYFWNMAAIGGGSCTLTVEDATLAPNYCRAADPACDFAIHGFVVGGINTNISPNPYPDHIYGAQFDSTLPATNGVGCATYLVLSPPDNDVATNWTSAGSLGPYLGWGGTLSAYPRGQLPSEFGGWHTGRIGWG